MIYLDSSFLIELVEDPGPWGAAADGALAELPDEVFAVTPLVLMECLVGPLKQNDFDLEDAYRQAIAGLQMIPLDQPVFERAARLRAAANVKTPEAIHWAAAKLGGCTALWTADGRLAKAAAGFAVDKFAGLRGEQTRVGGSLTPQPEQDPE
ncbi:MAG: PIN domain-containing protein [Bifidobacteriaceae bacterium]|jgi:predicted nucleic acid-binding protein|nr:PIN domain-containing protein [Bifidobacteriaceae bacterium]